MKKIVLKSPAKVNLFLEVLGKRRDGYHNVETILEAVDLYDVITLKELSVPRKAGKEEIEITCPRSVACPPNKFFGRRAEDMECRRLKRGERRRKGNLPELPLGEENLAYQAASLLKERLKIERGVQITIDKRIPLASGLGGGSSDGASVLLGLNRLWNLGLGYQELASLARKIGADVPFFLGKGRALGRSRGDEIEPLFQSPTLYFVLISPDFEISTEWAYGSLKYLAEEARSIKMILSALKSGRIEKIGNRLYNRLEEAVIPRYPRIAKIKKRLLELGACGALMSGSGPSVFGLAGDYPRAEEIYNEIKKDFRRVFLLKSLQGHKDHGNFSIAKYN